MAAHVVRRVLLVWALLVLPATGFAQEAVLTGTVTDSTGAVLPGVTVTAIHEATGNRFVGVTDERGMAEMRVAGGAYRLFVSQTRYLTIGLPLEVTADLKAKAELLLEPVPERN